MFYLWLFQMLKWIFKMIKKLTELIFKAKKVTGFGYAEETIPKIREDGIPGIGLINVYTLNNNNVEKTEDYINVDNYTEQDILPGELVLFKQDGDKFIVQAVEFDLLHLPTNGSGGSGTGFGFKKSIKLVKTFKDVLGLGFHRDGWPHVFSFLQIVNSEDGILFDDFVEQNFCYSSNPKVYDEPWVGIFHHPPQIPFFGNQRERVDLMLESEAFQASKKNLKLAIALSNYLGDYLKQRLDCPVIVLKHPSPDPKQYWSPEKFRANPKPQIIQVGYYLRNTQLAFQIPPSQYEYKRLWIERPWIFDYNRRVNKYWNTLNTRTNYGYSTDISFVPPSQYDDLLCSNIIMMEVFEASASNGVLDCIVRNTPIIVNKHPAVVEYLGEDYPLYFTTPEEIPSLANKALEAHEYLKKMDKSQLNVEKFISNIVGIVSKL